MEKNLLSYFNNKSSLPNIFNIEVCYK